MSRRDRQREAQCSSTCLVREMLSLKSTKRKMRSWNLSENMPIRNRKNYSRDISLVWIDTKSTHRKFISSTYKVHLLTPPRRDSNLSPRKRRLRKTLSSLIKPSLKRLIRNLAPLQLPRKRVWQPVALVSHLMSSWAIQARTWSTSLNHWTESSPKKLSSSTSRNSMSQQLMFQFHSVIIHFLASKNRRIKTFCLTLTIGRTLIIPIQRRRFKLRALLILRVLHLTSIMSILWWILVLHLILVRLLSHFCRRIWVILRRLR